MAGLVLNKKILIVNTHGMGDVVMTMPTIKKFLELGYKVSLLIKSRLEEELLRAVCPNNANLECLLFSSFQNQGITGYWSLLKVLRGGNFDIAMAAHSSHDVKFNTLAYLSGSSFRVGLGGRLAFLNSSNVNGYKAKHKAGRNLEIATYVDSKINYESPDIPKYKSQNSKIEIKSKYTLNLNEEIIALAPGCGEVEKHKRWPIEKYAELAKQLSQAGKQVIVLGGPGEESLGEYICDSSKSINVHNFVGKISIQETLDLLFASSSLVANCNGLSHLGSLIEGLQIIGLFGPTDPYLTGPLSNELKIVSQNLDCSPCYKRGYITGCGNPVCMKNIEVENVYKTVVDYV